MISPELTMWVNDIWKKIDSKMQKVAVRSFNKLPYSASDGVHDDMKEVHVNKWTNGFFGGMMWILYAGTEKEIYRKTAENSERLLDKAFENYDVLTHDVGFLWHITSGTNYRLTKNKASYLRAMYAANLLAGRFRINGNYIHAWNNEYCNYSIIDTMMNLNLLYWASESTGDTRFMDVAVAHADMTMKHHVRPDGSVTHMIIHDSETGEVTDKLAGQGMTGTSSWSRGQAWALYGFTLAYIHTGKTEYLDTAKKVAHYFIASVYRDYLPRCDFRSPAQPLYYDSTAGAIAACGLIEIGRIVPEFEKELYFNAAINLLRNMEREFCNWNENEDELLMMGSEAYSYGSKNIPIIYGDYYFIEAIYKLKNNKMLFW